MIIDIQLFYSSRFWKDLTKRLNEARLFSMNSKFLISIVALALLLASVLSSYAKTRVTVSTSVSLAGVIGGGIYWYVSVGTRVSKKGSDMKVALLGSKEGSLNALPNADKQGINRPELYLPLYKLIF